MRLKSLCLLTVYKVTHGHFNFSYICYKPAVVASLHTREGKFRLHRLKRIISKNLWTHLKNTARGTSLVVQWMRICLAAQGTLVWSLVREDSTYHGAAKPVCHNRWASTLGPSGHKYWARVLQLLKPMCPRAHALQPRVTPTCNNWRKPACSNEDSEQPQIKWIKF